jgi:hypothetical protein
MSSLPDEHLTEETAMTAIPAAAWQQHEKRIKKLWITDIHQ